MSDFSANLEALATRWAAAHAARHCILPLVALMTLSEPLAAQPTTTPHVRTSATAPAAPYVRQLLSLCHAATGVRASRIREVCDPVLAAEALYLSPDAAQGLAAARARVAVRRTTPGPDATAWASMIALADRTRPAYPHPLSLTAPAATPEAALVLTLRRLQEGGPLTDLIAPDVLGQLFTAMWIAAMDERNSPARDDDDPTLHRLPPETRRALEEADHGRVVEEIAELWLHGGADPEAGQALFPVAETGWGLLRATTLTGVTRLGGNDTHTAIRLTFRRPDAAKPLSVVLLWTRSTPDAGWVLAALDGLYQADWIGMWFFLARGSRGGEAPPVVD